MVRTIRLVAKRKNKSSEAGLTPARDLFCAGVCSVTYTFRYGRIVEIWPSLKV